LRDPGLGIRLGVKSFNMQNVWHWIQVNVSVLAIVVTTGVGVLLVCCMGCSHCPCREKDEIFHRNEV
jgi:hypothetical protein